MTAHKHAALMLQYAQDAQETDKPWERWQVYRHGAWYSMSDHPAWECSFEYRRKPRTIRIGEFDVPEPVREPLEDEQEYWVAATAAPYLQKYTWCDDAYDAHCLDCGLIHLTKEAAQQHIDALLSFTRRDQNE